jgi:hypothetical protein
MRLVTDACRQGGFLLGGIYIIMGHILRAVALYNHKVEEQLRFAHSVTVVVVR